MANPSDPPNKPTPMSATLWKCIPNHRILSAAEESEIWLNGLMDERRCKSAAPRVIQPSIHPTIHSSNHPFIQPSIHPTIHSSIHPLVRLTRRAPRHNFFYARP